MYPRAEGTDPAKDRATIRAALAGDPSAGERLAQRLTFVPRIVASLNARRGRPFADHDVEDLSQDVLLAVWKKLEQFEGYGSFEAWLYRFCVLEWRRRLHRAWNEADRRSTEADVIPSAVSSVPGAEAPESDVIEAYLEELGPPDADIVRLKHYSGMSFTEIGEAARISPNTAKSRYYRGLRWLRERMAKLEGVL